MPNVTGMDKWKNLVLPHPHEETPRLGEEVMVISRKFRCRGYIDAQGIWHYLSDGDRIEDVIGWLPVHRQPPLNGDQEFSALSKSAVAPKEPMWGS
jgi:hypothetical protein